LFAWRDWTEWQSIYNALFFGHPSTKPMILSKLSEWLASNTVVAGSNTTSGIAHAKYLKMQKILLEQQLS
jgi:hypothetical protein